MGKADDKDIRQRVFDITRDFLIKHGVKGWNMNDLAEASGMSKRTLYKIISSKEDLLYKCNYEGIHKEIADFESLIRSDLPYETRFKKLKYGLIDNYEEFVVLQMQSIVKEYPRIGKMQQEGITKIHDLWFAFFTEGKKQGYIKDYVNIEYLLEMIHAMIEHFSATSDSKKRFDEQIGHAFDVLAEGVLK